MQAFLLQLNGNFVIPSGHRTLEQSGNVLEIRSLPCSKVNFDVIPTSSARWVGPYFDIPVYEATIWYRKTFHRLAALYDENVDPWSERNYKTCSTLE